MIFEFSSINVFALISWIVSFRVERILSFNLCKILNFQEGYKLSNWKKEDWIHEFNRKLCEINLILNNHPKG